MSRSTAVMLLVVLCCLSGCAFFDAAFGVNADGSKKPGSSPIETVGGILGIILPWATTAAGVAATVYQEVRKRKYVGALKATIQGVNDIRSIATAKGSIDASGIVNTLATVHDIKGVRKLIRKVKAKVEKKAVA